VTFEIVKLRASPFHASGFHAGSGVCRIGSMPPNVTASVA
jgi:hypothetical protein